ALALLDDVDFRPEDSNAFADESAVGFELGFAGPAGADAHALAAAGDSLQVAPHPGQPGIRVLHLGQLNLELGFVGLGARGEDVEDQLGAIEDLDPRIVAGDARLL